MGKQLVLIGGGHAHMTVLANLHQFIDKGHRVTVIGPSPFHYYSGMGPGMLSKTYRADEIRFTTRHVVEKQGGKFILGKAKRVDPKQRLVYLHTGETVSYDILSFNIGSFVPWNDSQITGDRIFSVKPIEGLLQAQKCILSWVSQKETSIGIVGGGPSAIEIAGNIWRLAQNQGNFVPKITVFAGRQLLNRFSARVRRRVFQSLTHRGIEINQEGYVQSIEPGKITLDSGHIFPVDLIFLATGVKPSPIFAASEIPTGPDGGLLVNTYLQNIRYPELFGGGDCIYFEDLPLDKAGVYAVRQNPILNHNLMAALEGTQLKPFDPSGGYLIIFNMGDGTGILLKKWIVFGGRLAFLIKDYIDRKFIKTFQAIE